MKYLVLTERTPQFDPACLDAHYAFLTKLSADGLLEQAGGFADKSGGAYVLTVGSRAEAEAIIAKDPVLTSGSSILTLREWNAKTY